MANRFSVEPANPLAALMTGIQGYDRGRASAKEAEIGAGRQEAMAALQSGSDPSTALARLIGVGDIQGATVLAKLHESQQQNNKVYGNVIYGQGPNGETLIGGTNAKGNFVPIPTSGFTPTLPTKTVDTGTGTQLIPGRAAYQGGQIAPPQPAAQPAPRPPLNPNLPNGGRGAIDINSEGIPPSQAARVNAPPVGSQEPIQPTPVPTQSVRPPAGAPGFIPKDIQGREAAERRGTSQGNAQANYPAVVSAVGTSLRLIDEAIKHPGRETATGLSGTLDPRNYIPGTDAKDFQARARQLEGRVFLDAFDQLRGAGAITEAEGSKATIAHGRLVTSQSDEEYVTALKELKGLLQKGLTVSRLKAAGRFDDADRELGLGAPDVTVTAPRQQGTAVPPAAVEALRGNPRLKAAFDAKYGKGAADRALGAAP